MSDLAATNCGCGCDSGNNGLFNGSSCGCNVIWEEAVAQVRSWLHERGEWLDENIHALQARAHPSRNHAYNH